MAPNETFVFQISRGNPLLATHPASIWLAENLRDDTKAREVLASLVMGCCTNVLFCSEPITDYRPPSQTENRLMHFYITCSAVFVPRNPTFLGVTQLPVGMKHTRESFIN